MKKWYLFSGLLLVVLTAALSCNKEKNTDPGNNALDRSPMLAHYANNYITPAYSDMVAKLTELKTKIDAFTTATGPTTMQSAQTAWRNAYITWQKVDMLEFGPAEATVLRGYMNIYPVTTSKVNNNIAAGSFDLEQFGNRDAQGFPALDYLLNGTTLDMYVSDAQANNRKLYLQAVAAKMLEKVTSVKNEWDAYKTTFVGATGTDVNSSLSQMVNAYVLYYERYLRSGKIGLPVGAMTGVAKPEIVEAFYSPDLSKELAVTALNSVLNFYSGKSYDGTTTGESMKSYLAALGTQDENGVLMAEYIETEINAAITSLNGLNTTIYNSVQNNRAQVLTIYDELQDVVPLLKVDMVSAFSISITYTDNDGD